MDIRVLFSYISVTSSDLNLSSRFLKMEGRPWLAGGACVEELGTESVGIKKREVYKWGMGEDTLSRFHLMGIAWRNRADAAVSCQKVLESKVWFCIGAIIVHALRPFHSSSRRSIKRSPHKLSKIARDRIDQIPTLLHGTLSLVNRPKSTRLRVTVHLISKGQQWTYGTHHVPIGVSTLVLTARAAAHGTSCAPHWLEYQKDQNESITIRFDPLVRLMIRENLPAGNPGEALSRYACPHLVGVNSQLHFEWLLHVMAGRR